LSFSSAAEAITRQDILIVYRQSGRRLSQPHLDGILWLWAGDALARSSDWRCNIGITGLARVWQREYARRLFLADLVVIAVAAFVRQDASAAGETLSA
jgi:hypothetical protein